MASPPRRYVRLKRGVLSDLPASLSRGCSAREVYALLQQSTSARRIPGVIRAGAAALAEEFGLAAPKLRRALTELATQGLVAIDADNRIILVRGAIDVDPPASSKVLIAWASDLLELPTCQLRSEVQRVIASLITEP